MKITFNGAAKEVGRSCVEIETKTNKFLLDAGIKITEHGNEYPLNFDVSDVDAVFLSHAHLDHSGALPLFHAKGMRCPIFCTNETKALSKILLKDSLHIEMMNDEYPFYDKKDIYGVLGSMRNARYKQEKTVSGIKYEFFDAGHIPGSASIMLNINDVNILYTGDIKTSRSELLYGADTDYGRNVDIMISEATYGDSEHPERQHEEIMFIKAVKQTLDKGGNAIIPVFGVGRAQEILLMLSKHNFHVPIYLDGMAKKVSDLFVERPKYLRDARMLKKALRKVKYVYGRERKYAIKEQGIFVSTAGMMNGGPIMEYMKHFWNDPNSSILLTGYQAEGTNGDMLLKQGKLDLDGRIVKVRCKLDKFDFSAHVGLTQLSKLVKKVNPKILLLNHGDKGAVEHLAKVAQKIGIEVHMPETGDSFVIEHGSN